MLARLDDKRGRPDSAAYRLRLFDQMAKAFPGATAQAPKDRVYTYELDDPDDGHVTHAAIVGNADAIVTDDSRAGFPAAPDLVGTQVQIVTPARFATNTVAVHPAAGLRALREMSARMSEPRLTPAQLLAELGDRYAMGEGADILGPLLAEQPTT